MAPAGPAGAVGCFLVVYIDFAVVGCGVDQESGVGEGFAGGDGGAEPDDVRLLRGRTSVAEENRAAGAKIGCGERAGGRIAFVEHPRAIKPTWTCRVVHVDCLGTSEKRMCEEYERGKRTGEAQWAGSPGMQGKGFTGMGDWAIAGVESLFGRQGGERDF